MRVPLGWLSEWIDLPESRDLLVDRLTAAGLEVEQILRTGPDLSALRIGLVRECGKHPDADRLSVCQVDVGDEEPLTIVCGAPNVAAGQKVAVAPVGTVLPGGLKIKKSRIRGVGSHGMICSAVELGLGEDADGILVLDPSAAVGAPLESVLPAGETVLDVEITPNRGDWVSLLGMAREVRASFGGELRLPECAPNEEGAAGSDVSIGISDRSGCARYVGRVVRGVRVGASPDWLVARIEAAGLRSVNNVVDVTNLVMLEFGQPLHAFDLAKLRGGRIDVRAAEAGEKIRTLDGHLRELAREDLVIADAEGAIAVAGVMGGAESEVSETTQDLLLESAYFEPARVRRTARRLGLSSDASYRFERGVDPDQQARAADRAARLIAELAGGAVGKGRIEATGDPVPLAEPILLSPARVNRLLGTELEPESVRDLLERIEVRVEPEGDQSLRCAPPRYRPDLRIAADLVEEVARIHGYDQLPSTLPETAPAGITLPPRRETREAVRDALVSAGLYEIMTLPFVGEGDADGLRLEAEDPRRRRVHVVNPIQAERPWLRTELLSSVLRAARSNRARQVDELRCFEVARVFRAGEQGALPAEPMEAACVLAPGTAPGLWGKERAPVFFEAKGLAERLLGELGAAARFRGNTDEPFLHPGASGEYRVGRERVLVLGELHPEVQARFEIEGKIAVVCIDIDALDAAGRKPAKLRELSRFPTVERDLAVLLASDAPAGEVARAIRDAGGAALQHVEIFDRFAGQGVPEGRVSVAFRLVFQRLDRTLQEQEVSQAVEKVMTMLGRRYGGELRERTAKQGEGS